MPVFFHQYQVEDKQYPDIQKERRVSPFYTNPTFILTASLVAPMVTNVPLN